MLKGRPDSFPPSAGDRCAECGEFVDYELGLV
jgi:hypothetical protein